jgi:putative ABC transport system substrate-binding protein
MRLGAILLALLCLVPGVAAAQEETRVYRVGFLWLGSAEGAPFALVDSFRAGMRENGYAEGRNLQIELRDGHGRADLLPRAAADLVALKVDLILTSGTAATIAAKEATTRIPIVFGGMPDPVGRGVVASLAHPGANITGLSRELGMDKALDLLKALAPDARRVALVYHSGNMPAAYLPVFMAERADTAKSLGLTLTPLPVKDSGDVDTALATLAADHADAALILNDALLFENQERLLGFALEHHIATACLAAYWAKRGCLFSYGEDSSDNYRRAATLVAKILKGAKPAELPVEQGTSFPLAINLKTAKALGLMVPQAVLAGADEVIE